MIVLNQPSSAGVGSQSGSVATFSSGSRVVSKSDVSVSVSASGGLGVEEANGGETLAMSEGEVF